MACLTSGPGLADPGWLLVASVLPRRGLRSGQRTSPHTADPGPGLVLVVGVLLALGAAVFTVVGSQFGVARPVTDPSATAVAPSPTPLAALRFRAATVTVQTDGLISWAGLDRRTGEIWGSPNLIATSWPASMIKGWISADYLRRLTEAGRSPSRPSSPRSAT